MSDSIKNRFKLQTVSAKVQLPFPAIEYTASGVDKVNVELRPAKGDKSEYLMVSIGIGLIGAEAVKIMDKPVAYTPYWFFREGEILGGKPSRDKTALLNLAHVLGLAELVLDEESGVEVPTLRPDVYEALVDSLPEDGSELEVTQVFLENLGTYFTASSEPFNVGITHRTDAKTNATYANVTSFLPFAELE